MLTTSTLPLQQAITSLAQPLNGAANDYDSLLDLIGDARFVLLGEASHGTHEFYQERARITQRLIAEKGFSAVAVEADWPDACRVNRYVRGETGDASSEQALGGFKRFPAWMWRNTDVVAFIDWLHAHNAAQAPRDRIGFYGLDLYSMFASIEEVLRYLDQTDPQAAKQARQRYACFDHFEMDSQRYGYAAAVDWSASCEDAVVAQMRDLHRRAAENQHAGQQAADELFHARQNARLVSNAEAYYRAMFRGRISSWNLRDRHMSETLDALARHLSDTSGKPAKIVVWAHNSHVDDARATESGDHGEWTVGQLAREMYGAQARLIGMTTSQGTVTAASDWDRHAERKRVRPAMPGSYERAFHDTGMARFMLPLNTGDAAGKALEAQRLTRAIGVIYRPETERQSHYLFTRLPQQFDAVLHFDVTSALTPLEPGIHWEAGEAPETYPVGL